MEGTSPLLAGERIDDGFRRRFAGSAALHDRASRSIAGGITHDTRHLLPFPIAVDRAAGARVWDVDGNELVDHWMGQGAVLLGHADPTVGRAVADQLGRGAQYGSSHPLEVAWAELICQLVPSADRVRFTSSGTEATLLALRQARALTGRERVIRFAGHYHGWHDYAMLGYQAPFDTSTSLGVPQGALDATLVAYPNRLESVEALLEAYPGEVAAVILEPAGGTNGIVPCDVGFLRALRELTRAHGVVLIFDEVVSGFRYAPGGVQELSGVLPDLTALGKAMGGGLPCGAVAGRAEVMAQHAFVGELHRDRYERVLHHGTFNANPLSASAGVACLRQVADRWPLERADRAGEQLREGLREVLRGHGVPGVVVGASSVFQVLLGEGLEEAVATCDVQRLMAGRGAVNSLQKAMLLNGVDLLRSGGFVSAAHGPEEIAATVGALDRSLELLKREHLV